MKSKIDEYLDNLRDNLLYEMGKDELTNVEMSKKCGISERKLEEIIYRTPKGINFSTLVKISENLDIPIQKLLEKKI